MSMRANNQRDLDCLHSNSKWLDTADCRKKGTGCSPQIKSTTTTIFFFGRSGLTKLRSFTEPWRHRVQTPEFWMETSFSFFLHRFANSFSATGAFILHLWSPPFYQHIMTLSGKIFVFRQLLNHSPYARSLSSRQELLWLCGTTIATVMDLCCINSILTRSDLGIVPPSQIANLLAEY